MIRLIRRTLTASLLVSVLHIPSQALALSYQTPPVLDELASPFTESEVGGIGCIVSSVLVGAGMVYLLGGFWSVLSALATPVPPARVLEGSAAAAFVFSSTCYIGVALAPLAMATYTTITDNWADAAVPNKPLYAPGELERAASGTFTPPNPPANPANNYSAPSP